MKTNPLKEGALTGNSAGLGTVTQEMVRVRAVELAVINGRSAQDLAKPDWGHEPASKLSEFQGVGSLTFGVGDGVFTPLCERGVGLTNTHMRGTGQHIRKQLTQTVPLPGFKKVFQKSLANVWLRLEGEAHYPLGGLRRFSEDHPGGPVSK